MMGHTDALDKIGYDKSPWQYPEHFDEQYDIAQTWLNVFSEDPDNVPRREVEAQRRQIRELEAEVKRLQAGKDDEFEALRRRLDEQDKLLKLLYESLKEE